MAIKKDVSGRGSFVKLHLVVPFSGIGGGEDNCVSVALK